MGFRFHRAFKILPGLRLNVGKRGLSLSAGVRGARVTFGSKGVRATAGIPGTGLSYSHYSAYSTEELEERIDAMSTGQRKELMRRLSALPVQYQFDGTVHGPIAIGQLATLIVRKKVPEMVYVRESGDAPWDLIHGGCIRYAQRLEAARNLRVFFFIFCTGMATVAYLTQGFGLLETPPATTPVAQPTPIAHAATPFPHTPSPLERQNATRQREALEIARKYAAPR